jgi:hypothetical protein
VAQLYLQAPGSLFVTFYDSQGYGTGILTSLHTELNNTAGTIIRRADKRNVITLTFRLP